MPIESLNCPQCGAPLSLKAGQTLAACGYCNSSLRIAVPLGMVVGAPLVATKMAEIGPEVVDEVKRRLVQGLTVDAADYYAKEANVSEEEARAVVKTMKESIGYAPSLSNAGIAMFIGLELISLAGVVGGLWLLVNNAALIGVIVIIVALVFAVLNGFGLSRGLPAYLLERRGEKAPAKILKVWVINTMTVPGQPRPVKLLRLLLEIQPAQGMAYQAEGNCMVKEASQPNFEVGCEIAVKFDLNDRKKVVVIGKKGT